MISLSAGASALSIWPPRAPQKKPALRRLFRKRRRLLDRQDPLHDRPDVLVLDVRVGGHRDVAPDALAAVLDLGDEVGLSGLVAAVLVGDVLVRRADQLLVDGVAGEAAAGLGERLARFRVGSVGAGAEYPGGRGGTEDQRGFHHFSSGWMASGYWNGRNCSLPVARLRLRRC